MEAAALKVTISDKGRQGNKPRCTHCQKLGHEKHQCFELVGYPPNWGNRKINREGQAWRGSGSSSGSSLANRSGIDGRREFRESGQAAGGGRSNGGFIHHVHGGIFGVLNSTPESERKGDALKMGNDGDLYGLSRNQVENLFKLFKERQQQDNMTGPHLEEVDWSG